MKKNKFLSFLSVSLCFSLLFGSVSFADSSVNSSFYSARTATATFTDKGGDASNGGWIGSVYVPLHTISLSTAFDSIQSKLPDNAINVKYYLTRALVVAYSGNAIANNGVKDPLPSSVLSSWVPPRYLVSFLKPDGSFLRSFVYSGESSYELNYTPSFIRDMSIEVAPIFSNSTSQYPFVIDGSGDYYLPFPKISLTFRTRYQLTARYTLSSTAVDDINQKMDVVISDLESIDDSVNRVDSSIGVTNDKLDDVNSSLGIIADKQQQQIDQNQQFRDEDQSSAESMEGELNGFITNTQNTVKSKWEILWYPISFTNDLLTVFTGGTQSASYQRTYAFVEGFVYNEESGGLDPVINYNRLAVPRDVGGTSITFPAYTLPVLNLKIWDSFTYDLSVLKDQFPAAFNLLYVAEGCVEVYFFVSFLRDKYEEVFGS